MYVIKFARGTIHEEHRTTVKSLNFTATVDEGQVTGFENGVVIKDKVASFRGSVDNDFLVIRNTIVTILVLKITVVCFMMLVIIGHATYLQFKAVRENEVAIKVVVSRLYDIYTTEEGFALLVLVVPIFLVPSACSSLNLGVLALLSLVNPPPILFAAIPGLALVL